MIKLIIFLCLTIVQSRVHMSKIDMDILIKHKINATELSNQELQWIANEEWNAITQLCPDLDSGASISVSFDDSLIGTSTLAWAAMTTINLNKSWVSSLATQKFSSYDFIIGVNPQPPNGWYTKKACDDITYQYDLRTVLRHELLHGLGLGSSLRYSSFSGWRVGYADSYGICHPRLFDTKIKDRNGNNIISGCNVLTNPQGISLYLGGVQLYNPYSYAQGSSFSHHNYINDLMYFSLPWGTCLELQENEIKMLHAVNVDCPNFENYEEIDFENSSSKTLGSYSLLMVLILTLHRLL